MDTVLSQEMLPEKRNRLGIVETAWGTTEITINGVSLGRTDWDFDSQENHLIALTKWLERD